MMTEDLHLEMALTAGDEVEGEEDHHLLGIAGEAEEEMSLHHLEEAEMNHLEEAEMNHLEIEIVTAKVVMMAGRRWLKRSSRCL